MKESMGSFNIGHLREADRSLGLIQPGDTVSVKELTHVWNEPKPETEGAPHIREGSAELEAGPGLRFCMLFLGNDRKGKPLTKEDIEKRLNKLGWFRRDNG